jgi:hypothetical protein
MADQPQSYEQAFQSWLNGQSGYVGHAKKQQFKDDWNTNQQNNAKLSNLMSPDGTPDLSFTGSADETAGRIEGLQRAKILTGQNPYQIGQDYQQGMDNIRKRMNGSDTASELLRANKAGAVADTRSNLRAQGVKGGAAAGAAASVERQKAYDINNQVIQNERQAQNDFMSAVKANANFTTANEMNFGSMAAGKDIQSPQAYSGGFGALGTVVCTELFKQGRLDRKTFLMEYQYGIKTLSERPHVYWGYRYMADPIVKMMKKSKAVSVVVAFFVVRWAKHTTGQNKNAVGWTVNTIGQTVCGTVGKYILGVKAHGNQEKIRA